MPSTQATSFSFRNHYASWTFRSHGPFLFAMAIIIPLGLWSRRAYGWAPWWFHTYGGDTLWAMNLYCLLGFLWPTQAPRLVAGWTAFVCLAIEISQLWQAPWLLSLRRTTLGALLLGHGFLWSDLLCYALGVFLMWILDKSTQDLRATQ